MKRYPIIIIALLAAFGCSPPAEKQADIFPYPIVKDSLANGLHIVTVPYNSPGIASLYLVVRVGSRNEVEKGKTGFAHFFEHMMFRGTEKFPKEKYSAELKAIGASANANTDNDRTVYHMTGNASMLNKMFELESDRFMNLDYSEEDLKVEAGAVKGEYTKGFASPYAKLYEATVDTAFTMHTYSHTTIGYWEDVVDMPNQYAYSREFFSHYYRPEYTTLLVVGDVQSTDVVNLAKKYFGIWKRGDFKPNIPVEPEQTETRYAHIQQEGFPPELWLNYKGPAFSTTNKDMAALDVIGTLAFSEKSDIYKKLVMDEQKVRSIDASGQDSKDPNLWTVSATLVSNEDMGYVRSEINKVMEGLKATPVDSALLAQTKSYLSNSFAMRMDSPDAIAGSLSNYIWLTGDPDAINKTYANYDAITAEDIMDVANRYFVDKHLTVSTITPDKKYTDDTRRSNM